MVLVTAAGTPLEAERRGHSEGQVEGTAATRKTKLKRSILASLNTEVQSLNIINHPFFFFFFFYSGFF